MLNCIEPINYLQVEKSDWKKKDADVITELPVLLTVNGEEWLTFMCTPSSLEALAVGFLYNENVITSYDDIASVYVCPTGESIDIWTNISVVKPERWRRTSGCTGGITSIVGDKMNFDRASINGSLLLPDRIFQLVGALFEGQSLYQVTGGVHTSALSDGKTLQIIEEDIGRHNSLDKISGRVLLDDIQLSNKVLITTGRISSDMMQKAARLGVAIVISRTSPSSLSIMMAEKWGITLIGYARRTSFRIYCHPYRVLSDFEDAQESSSVEIQQLS